MNRGLNLDTGNVEVNRRYSFLQTPLEMHVPGLQPPANDDPAPHQHHHPQQQPAAAVGHDHARSSTNIENKEKVQAASPQHGPVASPYTLPGSPPPPPPEQHPANFAPYADEMIQHTTTPPPVQLQSPRQSDAPVPQYSYGPVPTSPGPLPIKADPSPSDQGPSARPVTVAPDTNPLHSPRIPPPTATGASQVPALEDVAAYHQPGQVRHPDQEIKGGTWSHSMCDCSNISSCCLGIFCPCVLYGKTQYRLGLKSRKEDPTNLLGYDSCNGSCTAMALLCPCQWLMATIQHTRTRKVYDIPGNVGSDCVRATCCTCCTLIQDETEIKKREEDRARVAAAQGATLISPYVAPAQMSYPPPPK